MAQKVKFKRKTTSEIDDLAIEDGSLIYNIENGKTYMDYGNERIPTGGGANGGIYVGDTEPTDPDITLWVDTPTSETKASEIVDEYTESDKVGYSTNYINECNKYSTDETFTGKYWIDGKPIYRKVYQNTSGSIPTEINISGLNVDYCYVDKVIVKNRTSTNTFTRVSYNLGGNEYLMAFVRNNTIQIRQTINGISDSTVLSTVVIIEYTKTTD